MNETVNDEDKTPIQAVIDGVYSEVDEPPLDQFLVPVDRKTYEHFLHILDCAPSGLGFEQLMTANKPWQQ